MATVRLNFPQIPSVKIILIVPVFRVPGMIPVSMFELVDPTCLLWILDVYRMLWLRIFWWDQYWILPLYFPEGRFFSSLFWLSKNGHWLVEAKSFQTKWPILMMSLKMHPVSSTIARGKLFGCWSMVLKAMMKSWRKDIGVLHDFVVVTIRWWKLWTIGILLCCTSAM